VQGEHPGGERTQLFAAAGVERARGRRAGALQHVEKGRRVLASGVRAGEEVEGGDAQGEDVIGGPGGVGRSRQVEVALEGEPGLGRAVVGSAGRKRVPGEPGGAEEGAGAEVGEEDVAVGLADEDVVTLDVAVDACRGMSGCQGVSEAREEAKHLTGGGPVEASPGVEGQAVDPLHDEEGVAWAWKRVPEALVEEARDVGVEEAGEQLGLASEALVVGVKSELESDGTGGGIRPEGAVDGAVCTQAAALVNAPGPDEGAGGKMSGMEGGGLHGECLAGACADRCARPETTGGVGTCQGHLLSRPGCGNRVPTLRRCSLA
jgi:hypothetical protein